MENAQIIPCPACGAKNRVPAEKIGGPLAPICGRCKKPLPLNSRPIVVTDATFSADVVQSALPVLLDMWAPWCGPCRMVAPMLDQLAGEMSGQIQFAKMNVDENPATASRFEVRSIPTLLILKNGREVDRIVGAQPAAEIKRRLAPFLS